MSDYMYIVREMLGLSFDEKIPLGLDGYLAQVDELCELAGGSLRSRQVVAMIIAQWKNNREKLMDE